MAMFYKGIINTCNPAKESCKPLGMHPFLTHLHAYLNHSLCFCCKCMRICTAAELRPTTPLYNGLRNDWPSVAGPAKTQSGNRRKPVLRLLIGRGQAG